ncbi:MAG: AMP-binding protein [Acidimicrobiales bacterium]|nr:AMP-binding protein [Acidimicrobiales bacterium]
MPRLVAIDADGPAFVDALRRAWDGGDAVAPIDPRLPTAARDSLLAGLRVDEPADDGDALVIATSGTSGEPKGVVLTHDAIAASADASNAALEVTERDRWWSCLPLAHIGGLSVILRALHAGTPFGFEADGAALVSVVPTMLGRIDPSAFRRVLLGGAAAPGDLPPNVVRTYGMTETGSGVAYDGRALDGVELRIVGGEIHVRGPMLLRCYRDGTDPKDADGWFPTGDAGLLVDGILSVTGRIGDVINTGGEKVWPAAVERALAGIPGVLELAVAKRPDPEWGERVVAFVVPDGTPPTLDTLRARVKETLPAYCAPKELVILDALPRTPSGKVQRTKLVR